MISILSLVTSVKDYVEIVHKLIESDSSYKLTTYDDLGPIITYIIITLKDFMFNVISLNWLKSLWDLPIIIPDISSAMISEISVLDGYFHNAFNFLDTPLSYGETNIAVSSLEKLTIGLINSLFLFIPTGTAHLITLRRFVMQGLEAGYLSGLGSICGNILWITSVIFGWRFFVIPWLSLDIFRYLLGFIILVKYMWDSYNERKTVITAPAKQKIFLLNFLLALTEQTSIYPFITNLSIGPESSILEGFPAQNFSDFVLIHGCYILGLTLGCLSLLQLTCWFWENPAFKIYMWIISSFKVSTSFYYKVLNFTFLYLTMICAISSIPYYGLDYAVTNPLGFVQDDRILDQKLINPSGLSFLNSKASDRNTRRNRGRHGRRERWKRRIRKYRTFDASLYDQGVYDLFTIEDLNYGFDRFWLRRKMRNHTVRFRFFPGPWMRSFKKQLAKPRLESYAGPRQEFFRILFEQVYHPSFHEYSTTNKQLNINSPPTGGKGVTTSNKSDLSNNLSNLALNDKPLFLLPKKEFSIYSSALGTATNSSIKQNLKLENSTLRKFVRKINNRIKNSEIRDNLKNYHLPNSLIDTSNNSLINNPITPSGVKAASSGLYSKRWKQFFSKIYHKNELTKNNSSLKGLLSNFYQNSLTDSLSKKTLNIKEEVDFNQKSSIKKQNSKINLSKKDKQILKYRSLFLNKNLKNETAKLNMSIDNQNYQNNNITFLHPLKFYLKKQEAFERKLRYYTPTIFRKFAIENNAPYFRIMMKRYFYYYKPTLRWERTMKVASLRKARRKTSAPARKIQFTENSLNESAVDAVFPLGKDQQQNSNLMSRIVKPTHNYTIVGKRANRYRYQIYKDVLQHWYYSPFNRFLLKLDIDLFIKRQPNSHFLTKNEEKLLHFRRFLLSEHYNTLRWYTYMQHYRSMKTKIGGTKSFASGVYNQQFAGTFKKIRHLFAITPSQSSQTVLKFDQPLYNEYYNNSSTPVGFGNGVKKNLIIHEELLTDQLVPHSEPAQGPRGYLLSSITSERGTEVNLLQSNKFITGKEGLKTDTSTKTIELVALVGGPLTGSEQSTLQGKIENNNKIMQVDLGKDLVNQSTQVIRDYLISTNPIKREYIKNLIEQKNYIELTQFLYKGEKTRGDKPVTNDKTFLSQEKEYLLTSSEKEELKNLEKLKLETFLRPLQQDLWVNLLKKWKRKINDQEFLKNYLQRRVEKSEKRKAKKEKNLKAKLQRLESLFNISQIESNQETRKNTSLSTYNSLINPSSSSVLSTGIQKALIEGASTIDNNKFKSKTKSKNLLLRQAALLKKEKQLKYSLNNLSKIIKQTPQKISGTNNLAGEGTPIDFQGGPVLSLPKGNAEENLKSTPGLLLKPLKLKQISSRIKTMYTNLKSYSSNFIKIKLINIFKPIKKRNFKNWQQKERSLNKQKRVRKEFKTFIKKPFKDITLNLNTELVPHSPPTRGKEEIKAVQKRDYSNSNLIEDKAVKQSEKINTWRLLGLGETQLKSLKNTYIKYFTKKFKRKTSPQRRARIRKNRGVTKKRTLSDSLKREFKNLRKYNLSIEAGAPLGQTTSGSTQQKTYLKDRLSFYSSISKESTSDGVFKQVPLQRRSKQKKQRFWKQKRSKFSQNLRKYRKRRRSVLAKVRILNKQLKRIQATTELKNWWWKNFLPNLRATTNSLWQYEKDQHILNKLLELSIPEILERNKLAYSYNLPAFTNPLQGNKLEGLPGVQLDLLQVGNFDYKPLALPETIKLRENLLKDKEVLVDKQRNQQYNYNSQTASKIDNISLNNGEKRLDSDILSRVVTNSILSEDNKQNLMLNVNNPVAITNPLPFYAGWDESLRKFVVTNRLLSRRESGYEMNMQQEYQKEFKALLNQESSDNILSFTAAPLKGMNAATTLYWQIPFTTYDPDQFFALGMDGFAPLGWRRFQFRHSILKSWLYEKITPNRNNEKGTLKNNLNHLNTYIVKNKTNILQTVQPIQNNKFVKISNKTIRNINRRVKKRYRRVKKHPRSPVWFPSGPLLNQVLPVHYIYIFYKRSRLPRDRYIKRRLRKSKAINSNNNIISSQFTDFTLRKRIKTKRKYHIKQYLNKKTPIIPRRMKFVSDDSTAMRWRPLSRQKLNRPIAELIKEQRALKSKQRKKEQQDSNSKQPANIRVKQLRRRVQRQIIRPFWRYKPRAGGFVWPGDYLKLELVKAPKLNAKNTDLTNIELKDPNKLGSTATKVKRKKKRTIQEWQIQPKKYLLQKHNYNVIKKKLEKAHRSNKIRERIKELSLTL